MNSKIGPIGTKRTRKSHLCVCVSGLSRTLFSRGLVLLVRDGIFFLVIHEMCLQKNLIPLPLRGTRYYKKRKYLLVSLFRVNKA